MPFQPGQYNTNCILSSLLISSVSSYNCYSHKGPERVRSCNWSSVGHHAQSSGVGLILKLVGTGTSIYSRPINIF